MRGGFDAFPSAIRDTAREAIATVFGSATLGAVTPVSGGATSASLFRVELRGRPYLLRIEGAPSPLRNPHQYLSLRIAADAGVAPRLLHVDEARRVIVTDFIEQRPLHEYPGGPRVLARALGELLGRLQAVPVFPDFIAYPDMVARLFAHVRRTGLFAGGLLDAHGERLARISEAHPWNPADLVPAHNDPNPRNILFDGERLWLIDWESAYRNDPLVDVAIMLDTLAPSPELENTLLTAWRGRAPDDALRARLTPIRALTRLYYAGVLLSASALAPRAAPDADPTALTPPEFRRALHEGRLRPGTTETAHALGKMYLASFLSGGAVPGLAAAIDDGG
jgi:aminoglycoside phosphotransferase (APT) family kinase protein